MRKKGFAFKDTTEIKIGKFIGYKLKYRDENSGIENAESIMIDINGVNYVTTYSQVSEFNLVHKNKFLNSIRINENANPIQISKSEKFNLKSSFN